MWWIIGIIAWLACGVFAWGWEFPYWREKFADIATEENYKQDLMRASSDIFWGPLAILIWFSTIRDEKIKWYGWRLW